MNHAKFNKTMKGQFVKPDGANNPFMLLPVGQISTAVLALCILGWGCKEPLPPYENPIDALKGGMQVEYTYGPSSNHLVFDVSVRNEYEEVLQGEAFFEGEVEIIPQRYPQYRKTIFFHPSQIDSVDARYLYSPETNTLTLKQQESVHLILTWNFEDDDDHRDWKRDVFLYGPDPRCSDSRKISEPETFMIIGRLKLYDRIEPIALGPAVLSMCHIQGFSFNCPVITPQAACGSR